MISLLVKHTPEKQKKVRANNPNFMTKELRKEIIQSSKFRSRFPEERTREEKAFCSEQRNLCISLLR